MMDDIKLCCCGAMIGIILGFGIGIVVVTRDMRNIAIEHGAAQYNPTTGAFEWKDGKK